MFCFASFRSDKRFDVVLKSKCWKRGRGGAKLRISFHFYKSHYGFTNLITALQISMGLCISSRTTNLRLWIFSCYYKSLRHYKSFCAMTNHFAPSRISWRHHESLRAITNLFAGLRKMFSGVKIYLTLEKKVKSGGRLYVKNATDSFFGKFRPSAASLNIYTDTTSLSLKYTLTIQVCFLMNST